MLPYIHELNSQLAKLTLLFFFSGPHITIDLRDPTLLKICYQTKDLRDPTYRCAKFIFKYEVINFILVLSMPRPSTRTR